jgi:hypothetical protein
LDFRFQICDLRFVIDRTGSLLWLLAGSLPRGGENGNEFIGFCQEWPNRFRIEDSPLTDDLEPKSTFIGFLDYDTEFVDEVLS